MANISAPREAGERKVSSGITGLSRAGHGKLIPLPLEDIEFDVVYSIELKFPNGLDRNSPPSTQEVDASVSVKPWFDEDYLPDGAYQLQTESVTWWLQRRAGSWELSEDSLQNVMHTKVRAIAPQTSRTGLTPSLVGLYQINAVVPKGTPLGNTVPVTISVAGQSSPAVVMAIL
jgi:hypothetical protein